MNNGYRLRHAVRAALGLGSMAVVGIGAVHAQDQDGAAIQEVVVTGTRIRVPGVISSSPILSVGAAELAFQQQSEVGDVLASLPGIVSVDNGNTNNGTDGANVINLRGLGEERNLILVDGKRLTPYSVDGLVDTSTIPAALIERIDIITGGASAVYGSDAISGAVNFVMKRDYEGIEINTDWSRTGENDGQIGQASVTMGTNMADGRGNIVLNLNWYERDGVQLGSRPLGQLGIETATGVGFSNFQAGLVPTPPPAGCGGPGSVAAGGSSTTLPTRVSIAGGPALGQFREDGTLGANCGVFNFNPFNYYQTPLERFGGSVIGRLEVNEHAEAYSRFSYTSTKVRQQVAPSGFFGNAWFTPLANPFIGAQARTAIITAAEAGRVAGTVSLTGALPNWRDLNTNGVVDVADDLLISYRRRTVEFGERSTTFEANAWQFLLGVRGGIGDSSWDYDLSVQRGDSDRSLLNAGYTNVANGELAVNAVSTTTCRSGGACVPINLFGGFGSITPEMAAFSSATAIQNQRYSQTVYEASVSGAMEQFKMPWAETSLAVSAGAQYREESGETIPDECLKLAPVSCLGGAGGNILPIKGGFDTLEFFGEAILPLVSDRTGIESLNLELGYRIADYDPSGTTKSWKYGLSWRPIDQVLFRAMQQRAVRAPNVGELAAPRVASLDDALLDPCSIENAGSIDATLRARCIATGMTNAQVGTVEDIVAGQVNTFSGTDLTRLPLPELADTLTVGLVWTPDGLFGDRIRNTAFTLDYYNIELEGPIDEYKPQEVLDACYINGAAEQCAKILRIGGTLTLPGSGIESFTTNLLSAQVEGVEFGANFGVDIGNAGSLAFGINVNKILTQETQPDPTLPILDCKGRYGNSCEGPRPDIRWTTRTTWLKGPYSVSAFWRHFGKTQIEDAQFADTFPAFRQIDAYDWFDLTASYDWNDMVRVTASVQNLTSEDPPVVGNEAGDTASNSGNTFPGAYDPLGRVISLGVNFRF